ncbi:MAG TPA: hypothetical protein VMS86_15535, partial [Thermoanaerobaculia bacterium]|nr:hypothetical protein [Thermoanaerobaculia bacterium]
LPVCPGGSPEIGELVARLLELRVELLGDLACPLLLGERGELAAEAGDVLLELGDATVELLALGVDPQPTAPAERQMV